MFTVTVMKIIVLKQNIFAVVTSKQAVNHWQDAHKSEILCLVRYVVYYEASWTNKYLGADGSGRCIKYLCT